MHHYRAEVVRQMFQSQLTWQGLAGCIIVACSFGLSARSTQAQDASAPSEVGTKVDSAEYEKVVDGAIDFLRGQAEIEDGKLSSKSGIAVTSLCVRAVLEHRAEAINDPLLRKSLAFIQANVHEDGGIYSTGSTHRNYETCLAIGALQKANVDGRFDETLSKAESFIKGIQWDQGEGIESDDVAYGGAGYGSHNRPDLSNTAFMVEALHELGRGPEDEAIQKALAFISRTQNLESSQNTTPFANKINDGGFYYTPAAGGESKAGVEPNGGLRSYGSMTYAGLKSMLYAGVDKEDPRVKAALDFIRANYSLEQNPGMGAAGLYYYYHTFAKALDAAEIDVLVDREGNAHHWRKELFEALQAAQSDSGSWVNTGNTRWMEGDRALVTGYALLALKYCDPN